MTEYYVSTTPSEGDIVVPSMTTAETAVHTMEKVNTYKVTRVNFSTGRGTVRHSVTGKAVQIVRGRFDWWKLADGFGTTVSFCREATPAYTPVASIEATIEEGDQVLCAVADLESDQLVGTVQADIGSCVWRAAQVHGATWPTAQQAADALVKHYREQNRRKLRDLGKAAELKVESEDRYVLQTVADVPFGHYPSWENGGPSLVVVDGWGTSCSHGDGIDGYRINAYRVPWTGEHHELDGTCYPTRELADEAKYNAGLIAHMVYTDRTYPTTV